MLNQYSSVDIAVFIAYLLLLAISGYMFSRKANSASDYFLGGNAMPVWAVAISVLATSQSAATFLGGPDQGYRGDLSYLASNIGAFIAALIVSLVLIPRFYQARVFTVYELLQDRFGSQAKQQAGSVYLFGRLLASGARLYMAAIAVSMILFGDIAASSVVSATLIITLCGLLYTVYGGVRSVIYSDVIQCVVYVSAAIAVIIWLLSTIPADLSTLISALQQPLDGAQSKLTLFDWRWDFSAGGAFTMWSVLTGFVLLNIAAFGLDQDMTQRVLTCKTAKQGASAMMMSIVLVIPVMLLFITIGLLLYIYYQRPDVMQLAHHADAAPSFAGETVTIFMYYVLTELPAGLKAWVTIGIIAAALSTLNSGLNSMASVVVNDMLKPHFAKREHALSAQQEVRYGQWMMAIVAILLASVACICFYWQQYTDTPLLQFALSVMVFSYSGLLGVYIAALFSNRGSKLSVLLALVVGFAVPLALQPYVLSIWYPSDSPVSIAFTWQLMLGTVAATLVCLCGKPASPATANPPTVKAG
ncbi:sodium:solute symporter [Alteromonas facilis]|uniref:sodium:solute symporter n=1 Tax=Alteromonas facilis TaxID=2048004 RepID=UPI000C294E10|nr:sodium:solute symporter [Alteromonas facilis]